MPGPDLLLQLRDRDKRPGRLGHRPHDLGRHQRTPERGVSPLAVDHRLDAQTSVDILW